MMTGRQIHSQEQFRSRIAQEWRRAERSGRPVLLIVFDGLQKSSKAQESFVTLLSSTFRETDVIGWLNANTTLGVLCLELGDGEMQKSKIAILAKLRTRLFAYTDSIAHPIRLTTYTLPPYTGQAAPDDTAMRFAERLRNSISENGWLSLAIQRTLDFCGSLLLLVVLSPLLLIVAMCIRLTSSGPALFHQTRAGLGGRTFVLCKFRTMTLGTDDALHRDYVKRFINGEAEQYLDADGRPVYKLTNDPRITRIGSFLRRTSLDELPQLWNVLRGEMSLVGPRPPLPYEVECYDLWHRRRVYELKPGLTGLWQVRGRCRCSFDEMIRMDLQHGRKRSLGLYVKVLLETPLAVIHGNGAQ